jgi:hypothetical protein
MNYNLYLNDEKLDIEAKKMLKEINRIKPNKKITFTIQTEKNKAIELYEKLRKYFPEK